MNIKNIILSLILVGLKSLKWSEWRGVIMSTAVILSIGIEFPSKFIDNLFACFGISLFLLEVFKNKTIHKKTVNSTVYEVQHPMQVETINFTSEKAMADALNRQLDSNYKADMCIQLIDDYIINEFDDEEANNLMDKYKNARNNCWKTQNCKDFTQPTETEKFTLITTTRTEEEYQELKQKKEEALGELKKYLKKIL